MGERGRGLERRSRSSTRANSKGRKHQGETRPKPRESVGSAVVIVAVVAEAAVAETDGRNRW